MIKNFIYVIMAFFGGGCSSGNAESSSKVIKEKFSMMTDKALITSDVETQETITLKQSNTNLRHGAW